MLLKLGQLCSITVLLTLSHTAEKLRFLRAHRMENGKKGASIRMHECSSHPSADIYSGMGGVMELNLSVLCKMSYTLTSSWSGPTSDKQEQMEGKNCS